MPNYEVPNIIEIVAKQEIGDTQQANVFFIHDSNNVGVGAAVAAAAPIFDAFYNAVGVHCSTTWSIVEYIGTEVDTDTPMQTVVQSAVAGDLSDAILPRQTALCLSWKSAFIGRRRRGRSFLVGFTEAGNTTDGVPTSTLVSDVLTAGSDLHTDLDAADVPLVILSRGGRWLENGHVVDPDPPIGPAWEPFVTNVTGVTIDSRWDTQRRRRLS